MEVKNKYNLPDKFIFHLGTFEPRKNIIGIVRAYDHLIEKDKRFSDYKLVIAGGAGWKNREIHKTIKQTKNFLNIKFADDSNQHTQNYIEMCKGFSDEVIKEDFGIQEKSKFLAHTVDFFKENEQVNIENFKEELFEEDDKKKGMFDDYKKQFETLNDVLIRNQFDRSDIVLKKQKAKIKTEIKLDTNIQI